MRVLATYGIKGGVGKTSSAVNLAYLAARDGSRVLLWDLDPQASATYLLRVKPRIKGGGRRLILGQTDLDARIKATDYDRFDLLPGDASYEVSVRDTFSLAGADQPRRTIRRGKLEPPSVVLLPETFWKPGDSALIS